jgi:uncharacterized protein
MNFTENKTIPVSSPTKTRKGRSMKTYVLYHGNCYDGFGAAWAAWKRLGTSCAYIPVNYGQPPPEMLDCDRLYILDFSYPRDVLLDLAQKIFHVTVIDHHKTAQADLEGLGRPAHEFDVEHTIAGLYTRFDMKESGASLAWNYFYKPQPPEVCWTPQIIKYVKDRDLWLFQQPDSKEVHAWLRSQPFELPHWNWLNHCLTDDAEYVRVVAEGTAILRSQQQDVENMCRHPRWVTLGGYSVPCVNATVLFSECGDHLCEDFPDAPFAAYYLDRSDGKRQWGLRSRSGFDVSTIAKQYGGGGHAAAAGFTTNQPPLFEGK